MMGALTLLRRYWNILLAFALAFVTLISEVLISPKINQSTSLASVNVFTLSKILIIAVTLIFIYPMNRFKQKKYAPKWWVASTVLLLLSLFQYFHYQFAYFSNTATDKLKEQTVVVGNTLLSSARPVYDSLMKVNKSRSVVNSMMLEGYSDDATDIWLPEEIQSNTMSILYYYLGTLLSIYFFVLCVAQAIYCSRSSTRELEEKK